MEAWDAFPKSVEDFRVRTVSGGVLSIFTLAVSGMLAVLQLGGFLWEAREAFADVVVDESIGKVLELSFDIVFPRVSCQSIAIEAVDASGARLEMKRHDVFKMELNHNLMAMGPVFHQGAHSSKTVLTHDEVLKAQVEAERDEKDQMLADAQADLHHKPHENVKRKSVKTCGSCYPVVNEAPIEHKTVDSHRCCSSCMDVERAFQERNWIWRKDMEKRFWQCRKDMKNPPSHSGEVDISACEVFGSLHVPKAKGSFHFGPSEELIKMNFFGQALSGHMTMLDLSHDIQELWFGSLKPEDAKKAMANVRSHQGVPETDLPLQGVVRNLDQTSLVHYYIQVVPTELVLSSGNVSTFVYAASEHVRPVTQGSMPSLHFFYDIPPLKMKLVQQSRSFAHLVTQLCAIMGGTYTVMALIDRIWHIL